MKIDILELAQLDSIIKDDLHDWGFQLRLVNEPEYSCKFLVLTNTIPGSLHFHHHKKETFMVLAGAVDLTLGESGSRTPGSADSVCRGVGANLGAKLPDPQVKPAKLSTLYMGDSATIEPNVAHRMIARRVPAIILETATHDDDLDTYRLKELEQ